MSITLTKEQKDARDKMKEFLKSPHTKGEHFVLTGGPGTGKTFLTHYVIAGYTKKVIGAAISHSAKIILADHMKEHVTVTTLAGLLGMRMSVRDDGTFFFVEGNSKYKPIHRCDAIILDEVSMIDDPLYDKIMDKAFTYGIKVIAMGDRYQLPPVEQEHDSKFFNKIDAVLTTPMRYAGPIHDLAEHFRNELQKINEGDAFDKWILNSKTERKANYDTTLKSGYSFTSDINELMEAAADDFKQSLGNNTHARVLAFKNESIKVVNEGIRKRLHGKNSKQFEENELVIANSNYRVPGLQAPFIHNGKVLSVDSYVLEDGPRGIPCAKLKFKKFNNYRDHPIYVVTRDDDGAAMHMYYEHLNRLKSVAYKNQGALKDYHKFVGQFAYFDYAYAVNLYRAQGATLENAYVLEGEVTNVKPLSWKQKFQALYVAMTRPRKNLMIHNKEF